MVFTIIVVWKYVSMQENKGFCNIPILLYFTKQESATGYYSCILYNSFQLAYLDNRHLLCFTISWELFLDISSRIHFGVKSVEMMTIGNILTLLKPPVNYISYLQCLLLSRAN